MSLQKIGESPIMSQRGFRSEKLNLKDFFVDPHLKSYLPFLGYNPDIGFED